MLSDMLTEIVKTLEVLKTMYQLNFELLEQLNVACQCLLENHITLPNEQKLADLLSKSTALLEEINTAPSSDGFLQRKKSDKDFTEPLSASLMRMSAPSVADDNEF